jgi:exopolysaccharide production protein ExoZ
VAQNGGVAPRDVGDQFWVSGTPPCIKSGKFVYNSRRLGGDCPTMLFSIQTMRFIASMAVVIHHSLEWFGSPIYLGAAGVDIFFVISGIVIGYSTKARTKPLSFLRNRLTRVMPVYWVATLAFIAFGYMAWGREPSARSVLQSFLLLPTPGSGWVPIYFPAWSLCYEMLFYLTYAALLWWAPDNINRTSAMIFGGLAAISVPVPGMPSARIDTSLCLEFSYGLLLAEMIKGRIVIGRRLGLLSIGIALLAFGFNHGARGGDRVITWGAPSFLMLLGILQFEPSRLWRVKPLIFGGNASYSIYLVHVTWIGMVAEFSRTHHIEIKDHQAAYLIAMVVGSFIVGSITHLLIERPLLAGLRQLFRSGGLASGAEHSPAPVTVAALPE